MKVNINVATLITAGTILTTFIARGQNSTTLSVANLAPSVIKTTPQAGETNVDSSLKEITVTFSKDMMTNRMWAVCQISKDSFPNVDGQIHYRTDNRTCLVPVRLES